MYAVNAKALLHLYSNALAMFLRIVRHDTLFLSLFLTVWIYFPINEKWNKVLKGKGVEFIEKHETIVCITIV